MAQLGVLRRLLERSGELCLHLDLLSAVVEARAIEKPLSGRERRQENGDRERRAVEPVMHPFKARVAERVRLLAERSAGREALAAVRLLSGAERHHADTDQLAALRPEERARRLVGVDHHPVDRVEDEGRLGSGLEEVTVERSPRRIFRRACVVRYRFHCLWFALGHRTHAIVTLAPG